MLKNFSIFSGFHQYFNWKMTVKQNSYSSSSYYFCFRNQVMLLFIYFHCMCACTFSYVRLFETPWTVAHQTPLSMGFLRQEYWSGLPFPPSVDLLDPGSMCLLYWQVDSLLLSQFFTGKFQCLLYRIQQIQKITVMNNPVVNKLWCCICKVLLRG